MHLGHFDDENREYVTLTPETPLPRVNYLGCDGLVGLISNTAGGYCLATTEQPRAVTEGSGRFGMWGGRTIYIHDEGHVWNPGWWPIRADLDHYECRHGLGYTKIISSYRSIEAELMYVVPLSQRCEVHQVRLTNRSEDTKTLQVFSCVEWAAPTFERSDREGPRFDPCLDDGNTIYYDAGYRAGGSSYVFSHSTADISGFDTDGVTFFGPYRDGASALVPHRGLSGGSVAPQGYPIASHQVQVRLEPGASQVLIFVVGYCENDDDDRYLENGNINRSSAQTIISAFRDPQRVSHAVERVRRYWQTTLERCSVHSGDPSLDRMMNTWIPYQCMANVSAGPALADPLHPAPFRDRCLEMLGVVHLAPSVARTRLFAIASRQREDGGAMRGAYPQDSLQKRYPDTLWLILAASAYIRETGDVDVLDEEIPFARDPNNTASLLEHLDRSFEHVVSHRGSHGLPLVSDPTWDSNPTVKDAESVVVAGLFVLAGDAYAELLERVGSRKRAEVVRAEVARMRAVVDDVGWDGQWFRAAYVGNGTPLGSSQRESRKIVLEPQVACTLAGIGVASGKAKIAMDSVWRLLERRVGIVEATPSRRNGSYTEPEVVNVVTQGLAVMAEASLGECERAWNACVALLPGASEASSPETEPYVYTQWVCETAGSRTEQTRHPWITAGAASHYIAITEHILGIRAEFEGLRIQPCLPAHLSHVRVTRRLRGVAFEIDIHRKGIDGYRLTVDGQSIDGTLVSYPERDRVVRVICEC